MGFTSNLMDKVLNHVFRNQPLESPAKVYVGLITANGEVDGNGYARQEINFGSPSNNTITNDNEIRFPIAHSLWGEITGAIIFDSQTGGTALEESTIAQKKTVEENEQFSIPVGNYRIRIRKGNVSTSSFSGEING